MALFGTRKPADEPAKSDATTQRIPPPSGAANKLSPGAMPPGPPPAGGEGGPMRQPVSAAQMRSSAAGTGAPSPATSEFVRAAARESSLLEGATNRPAPGVRELLREAITLGASDLHLSVGVPPIVRVDGTLRSLPYLPMSREECESLVGTLMNAEQRGKFERDWELDVSAEFADVGRFRVNIHRQRGSTEAAIRVVNDVILPLRKLGLPPVVEEVIRRQHGLVLVTGPTGSGKTTTLAAMVDQINAERSCMIVTIEDPIEYLHVNKRAVVRQREVLTDTFGFAPALRHVLRQDPDVIVIGEMRDLETISVALTAAETGHLVLATLHTPDACQTIDRIIDVFPPHHQEQARIQLANTLQAVVAQQLVPVPGNRGRVVAVEILIANPAVRKIVRSQKTEQLFTTMQTGWELGMITMDKSLKILFQQGLVSYEDAIARCKYPSEFAQI